jgi:GT2 family glycosyltransferase
MSEGAPSVVVPNWNGRGWLQRCLEGLAGQQLQPGEIIVVDNGSSDGSAAYLRDHHPGVRVLELATNTGFAHAANVGLDAARGELVALINTDVVLAPDWLARTTRALRDDPRAAAVACKMLSLHRTTLRSRTAFGVTSTHSSSAMNSSACSSESSNAGVRRMKPRRRWPSGCWSASSPWSG